MWNMPETRVIVDLHVTGSLGVLLKARARGEPIDLAACMRRMRDRGVWLSHATEQAALKFLQGS